MPENDEIQDILGNPDIPFEEITPEENSPLNEPVVNHAEQQGNPQESEAEPNTDHPGTSPLMSEEPEEPLDAAEQEIDEDYREGEPQDPEEEFELPTGHAKQAADTILGVTDNVLAVGGGFFVKIKKHKDFYEFEEVIQVIDTQNEKNVRRLQLDPEDKVLLRPLLIAVLKKKAKKLSPEQMLLGAVLSILMKKAHAVMEIRAENEILVERILDIIRQAKGEDLLEENDEDNENMAAARTPGDEESSAPVAEVLEES